jgi:MFS family permease
LLDNRGITCGQPGGWYAQGRVRQRIADFLRSSTEALSERDFRLLWIGQTGSAIGDALVGVALAFAVLGVGGSAADLGLVFAAFSLPRVVLTLAGGVWSDRLPRQRVMVACDLVRAAGQGIVAPLLITGNAQIWHLIALAVVMGGAAAFFIPASVGLMPQVVSRARVQQANALVSISQSGAHIFGPLLAGLIVATIGPGWAFAIDGASFLVSAGFLLAMHLPPIAVAARRSFVAELADGWREVISRKWVVASILTFSLSNVSLGAFQVLGPLVALRDLGGAAAWGVVVTGGAIGGLIGGAVALRWKPARPLVPGFGLMVLAQIQLLLLIPPFPAPVLAIGSMITIAAIVISNTFWDTMLQQHIPAQVLSRVSSYDWMGSLIFQPLAFAAVGPLSEVIGVEATLVVAATIGVVVNAGVLLVPSVRRLRRLEGEAWIQRTDVPTAAGEPTEPPLSPAGG